MHIDAVNTVVVRVLLLLALNAIGVYVDSWLAAVISVVPVHGFHTPISMSPFAHSVGAATSMKHAGVLDRMVMASVLMLMLLLLRRRHWLRRLMVSTADQNSCIIILIAPAWSSNPNRNWHPSHAQQRPQQDHHATTPQ